MRRVLVGAVAALALAVAGCNSDHRTALPERTASTPSEASAPSAPVTLRFAVYGDASALAAYREVAAAYTGLHPETTVRVQASPDARDAQRRLDRQLAHATAPDVFLVDHAALPQLVARGWVQPVDELLEKRGVLFGDNYQRLGLEAFSADSALQCMPHDVSPLVVFYNADLLHPATLGTRDQPAPSIEDGWTWDQFVTAARRISRGGVTGVAIPARVEDLLPLVRSAGADLLDDDRAPASLTFADGATRQALARVLRLVRDPELAATASQLARPDAVSLFARGKVGMVFGTRAWVPKLRSAPGLRFDVLPLPSLGAPRTVARMSGYCIAATSPHIEQAADFLTFASGPEGEKIVARTGATVPANLPALHSADFLQPGREPRHAAVFGETVRRADALPSLPVWPKLEEQVQPLLERLFSSPHVDLDALLPRIDARSRGLLAPTSAAPSPSVSPSG